MKIRLMFWNRMLACLLAWVCSVLFRFCGRRKRRKEQTSKREAEREREFVYVMFNSENKISNKVKTGPFTIPFGIYIYISFGRTINFSTIIFVFPIDFWANASNYLVSNLKHQISRTLNLLSSKGACDARSYIAAKLCPYFKLIMNLCAHKIYTHTERGTDVGRERRGGRKKKERKTTCVSYGTI